MAKPAVLIVGADKGGVGKTTVSRTLLDYFAAHQIPTRAFDTEAPKGTIKRFYPETTEIPEASAARTIRRRCSQRISCRVPSSRSVVAVSGGMAMAPLEAGKIRYRQRRDIRASSLPRCTISGRSLSCPGTVVPARVPVHVGLRVAGGPDVPPLVRPEYAAGWLALTADPGPLLGLPSCA